MSDESQYGVTPDLYPRPPGFRWSLGWIVAGLAAIPGGWLAWTFVFGRTTSFAAGPLSVSHRMIENDCARCHEPWGYARGFASRGDHGSTVANAKCTECHPGELHHAKQTPAHADLGCGSCHREHRGRESLADVADARCVDCHGDLQRHGGSARFASRIDSIDDVATGGHPEFALHRALDGRSAAGSAAPDVLGRFLRAEDLAADPTTTERWQDAAKIRFNHAKHLAPGLPGPDGRPVHLAERCDACHVPAANGRMAPIRYEAHCRSCHPLWFDGRFPDETVPHRAPEIVRGFLMDFSLGRGAGPEEKAAPAAVPGLPAGPRLPKDLLERVRRNVEKVENELPVPTVSTDPERSLLAREAPGGCRYCHDVSTIEAESGPKWRIEPPRIPERWYVHARFDHASHRMLDCRACHRDWSHEGRSVLESRSTGDVLVPPIAVCRECHTRSRTASLGPAPQIGGARAGCVQCHPYHDRGDKRHFADTTRLFDPKPPVPSFIGRLGLDLNETPRPASSTVEESR